MYKVWFPGVGKSSILLGCYGAHADQSQRSGYFYIWKFIAHFLKCLCFENCDGFFVQGFEETDQKTAKNDLE